MTVGSDPIGGSPRVYITAPNRDVRFDSEVFIGESVEIAHLIARSNHQDKDGFGGYYLYVNFKDQEMYFKKEQTHRIGYSSRLAGKPIKFERGRWHLMTITVKNIADGKVQVDGDFDGIKSGFIDDGQIKCGNDTNPAKEYPPFTEQAKWCFIRTNKPNDVRYRNASISSL